MNERQVKIIESKLVSLSKSKFRSSFHLRKKERDYVLKNGMNKIKEHACLFIEKNLSMAYPLNDGKQTPMKNHPVFIAQHATATCCRGCLEKWHRIPKGKDLTKEQKNYIFALIIAWISKEMSNK